MDSSPVQVRRDSKNRGVHSSLRIPADLTIVAFVRSAVACLLTREGWPGEVAGKVLLASTEALTNAIEHGSPLGGAIEVEIAVTRDHTRVSITDEGRPGAATPRLPAVAPPPTSTRGRGLLIISRLADEVELLPHGSGTTVSAGFLREPPPAALAHGARRAA